MFEDVPKDINIFVKANKLKTLKISVCEISLTRKKTWSWIVDLLDNNPGLEKIKIKLMYPLDGTNTEDKFYKTLIKAISKLKYFRKLKLSLNDDDGPYTSTGKVFPIKNT